MFLATSNSHCLQSLDDVTVPTTSPSPFVRTPFAPPPQVCQPFALYPAFLAPSRVYQQYCVPHGAHRGFTTANASPSAVYKVLPRQHPFHLVNVITSPEASSSSAAPVIGFGA